MRKIAFQSIQTTIFSYLGVVLGYINVLWLYPYALDTTQLGTFRTIQDLGLLLVPFAQLGLGHGITRYFPKLDRNHPALLTLSLFISLVGFGCVSLLFLVFKQQVISLFAANSPEVINFLGIVLFVALFSVWNSILDSFARSYVKVGIPTFFREVFLRLLTSILVALYLLHWIDFNQIMVGLAWVYGVSMIGVSLYLVQLGVVKLDFSWSKFPPGFKTSLINYSLVTFLATAASTLILKIDSVMISSMLSLEANAIYSIAFYMALVIELPRRAISQVAMPLIAEHFTQRRLKEINQLYKQLSNRQLYVCLLLFALIWANIDAIYQFVPNRDTYQAGKWVVLIIASGKLVDVAFSLNSEILVFSSYYRFNLVLTVSMSVLLIAANYFLIPVLGIEGAAIGSTSILLAYNLVKYGFLKWKLGLDPFSIETLKILGVGITTLSVIYLSPNMSNPFFSLVTTSLMVTGVFVGSSALFGAGKEEWTWLKNKGK